MLKPRRLLALLAVLIASFIAGAATAAWRGWGQPVVSIKIVNETGQPIDALVMRYGTCGGRSHVEAGKLAIGQSRRITYSVCGEGGYSLEAQLRSGTVLKGGGGYVMPGWSMKEVITEKGIDTTYDLWRL
jgi:hypothetical protein